MPEVSGSQELKTSRGEALQYELHCPDGLQRD
jgi:hypothetical protein